MDQSASSKWMHAIVGAALLLTLSHLAVAGEVQRLSCQATFKNVKHWFKISVEGERIVGFEYTSFTPQGHDCGFSAKRQEASKGMKSEWHDAANETSVEMAALGQKVGKVVIERKAGAYELRVLEQTVGSCGVAGYIVPHVRLSAGKNTCEFPTGLATPPPSSSTFPAR